MIATAASASGQPILEAGNPLVVTAGNDWCAVPGSMRLFTVENQFHSGKHNQHKCRDKSRRAADLSFGFAKAEVLDRKSVV